MGLQPRRNSDTSHTVNALLYLHSKDSTFPYISPSK